MDPLNNGGGAPAPDPMGTPPTGGPPPMPGPTEPTPPAWTPPPATGPTEPAPGGMPGGMPGAMPEPPKPEGDAGTGAPAV